MTTPSKAQHLIACGALLTAGTVARIMRQLVIVAPCPEGQYYCGASRCSSLPCESVQGLQALAPGSQQEQQEQPPQLSIQIKVNLLGVPTLQQIVLGATQGRNDTSGARRRLSSQGHGQRQAQQKKLLLAGTGQRSRRAAAEAPSLSWGELVDADGNTLYAAYGRPLSFSLAPCQGSDGSDAASPKCGVNAQDAQGNDVSRSIISAGIASMLDAAGLPSTAGSQVQGNAEDANPLAQLPCGVEMADQGQCLPGAYNIR